MDRPAVNLQVLQQAECKGIARQPHGELWGRMHLADVQRLIVSSTGVQRELTSWCRIQAERVRSHLL